MGKNIWRVTIAMTAFGMVIDLGLGFLIASVAEPSNILIEGLLVFLAIQALAILLYLRNGIASWAWFLLKGRAAVAQEMAEGMHDAGFPVAPTFDISGEDYLASLIENEHLPAKLRISAAIQYGAVMARGSTGFSAAIRTHASLDDAVHQLRLMQR